MRISKSESESTVKKALDSQEDVQARQEKKTASDEAKEALLASIALLISLAVLKPIGKMIPWVQEGVFIFAIGFQFYMPQILLAKRRQNPDDLQLHVHGLILGPLAALRSRRVLQKKKRAREKRRKMQSGFDLWLASWARGAKMNRPAILKEVLHVLFLCAFFFPLFAGAHHLWQGSALAGRSFHFRLPKDFIELLVVNFFLVAVAEEVFYRGFLEHRLQKIWPEQIAFWGIPLGRSVFMASTLFALGHFLGEWNPARLAPFFPAFVFSGLVRSGGSLLGAILFHGLSNVFSATLLAGYAIEKLAS